jgi:hypothetical protein
MRLDPFNILQVYISIYLHFGKVSARCKKLVDILIFIKQVGHWQRQAKFKRTMLFDVVEIGFLFFPSLSLSLPSLCIEGRDYAYNR